MPPDQQPPFRLMMPTCSGKQGRRGQTTSLLTRLGP